MEDITKEEKTNDDVVVAPTDAMIQDGDGSSHHDDNNNEQQRTKPSSPIDNDDDDQQKDEKNEEDENNPNEDNNDEDNIDNDRDENDVEDNDDDDDDGHGEDAPNHNANDTAIMSDESSTSSSSNDDDDDNNDDNYDDANLQEEEDDDDCNHDDDRGNAARHVDDDGHELSEYELLRLERIKRNKEKLAQLGLLNVKEQPKKRKKRTSMDHSQHHHPQNQQQNQLDDNGPVSRSSLSRSSKRNVNYAELGPRWSLSLSSLQKDGAVDQQPEQQSQPSQDNDNHQHRHPLDDVKPSSTFFPLPPSDNNNNQNNNTATAFTKTATATPKQTQQKKPRMAKFIYREFQRIQTLQQQTLKQAKRHCRWAKGHVQHWQRLQEKYQRHLERLQQLEERKQYGGHTLKDLLRQVDARQSELMQAARTYDQRKQAAANAVQMEFQRQEAAKKHEIVDALDRFPKVMKRCIVGLNKLLLERAPRDPPPPRRSKRKTMDGVTTADDNDDNNDEMDHADNDSPRPMKKIKSMMMATSGAAMQTLSMPVALPQQQQQQQQFQLKHSGHDEVISGAAASEQPIAEKRHAVSKNVGGWVSPQFAQDIDRQWLERDVPDTNTFRLETYVPQVGDTVLYYPEGHRIFLKAHPDVLGKKTRAIMRLPLWERARKEQQKNASKQQQRKQEMEGDDEIVDNVQHDVVEATADASKEPDATEDVATMPLVEAAACVTDTITSSSTKAQHWWNDEWLKSIENKNGVCPILCRVEKTQAEFPSDPNADKVVKKDTDSGNVQVIWKQKAADGVKKRDRRPPLCLAVTLRALMPIASPSGDDASPSGDETTTKDSQAASLPPKFTVVIFPSTVARPYLVPFSWGYRQFHSLKVNARVTVQSPMGMNGSVTGAKVLGFDLHDIPLASSRLDDHVPMLSTWFAVLQLNLESTPQAIFEALSQDFNFRNAIDPYPLVDALSLVETWMQAVKSQEREETSAIQPTSEFLSVFDFKRLVQKTLPVWNGVNVARDAYDRRRLSFSPWDLQLQLSSQSKLSSKAGRGSSSTNQITASLDSALRLKVEMTLEDFLKGNQEAEIFSPLVMDSEAPSYSCAVPLGMAFDRVLRRLAAKATSKGQCYYRHADAILSDIGMIEDNCLLYNSPDAEIVEKAGRIVLEAKRQVAQVVSSHNRELDSRLKEEEQRQRFVLLQCDAVVDSRQLEKAPAMASVPRKILDTTEMFTPFKDTLYRDWLQYFEPDGSWTNGSKRIAPKSSTANSVGGVFWIPQTGDRVFYCESAHAEFLRAHFQSLANEQCELPRLRRTQSSENDKDLQLEKNDESLTNYSSHSYARNTGWILGTIQKVKVTFPRRRPKQEIHADDEGFQICSPILALELRFEDGNCDAVTVHWRPCEFSMHNVDTTQRCARCGLSLALSFLHPAWLTIDRNMAGPPEQEIGGFLGAPTGLKKEEIESIDRCLNLLKRRCIAETPPDFVDKQQCISDLKRGILPSAKVKASSLPAFEDIFRVEKENESRVGTRGVRSVGPERHESVLAESSFLPRWVANEDAEMFNMKRCEMLFPCPNFSLELVQLRLHHGFYRQKAAILDDVEEAYIQAVLFLLAGAATRKKKPLSIKKLAKALSSKSNIARYFEPLSEVTLSNPKLNTSGALGSVTPLKHGGRDAVVTAETIDEETEWMSKLEKIRRLHAVALACVSETRMIELIFGTLPHQKSKVKETNNVILVNPDQEAARQKISMVLGAVGTDFCLNRFTWQLPQVRLKIVCGGEIVSGNPGEANSINTIQSQQAANNASLSFSMGDIRGNTALAQLFFGRPAKMNACARCQVYQRSMLECRVARMHSNIDFDWGAYCRDSGGIDGILQQLRPESAASRPFVCDLPAPGMPCPTNTMTGTAFVDAPERPTKPFSQDSSTPSVIYDSSQQLLLKESNSPSLTLGSNTPSLTHDPPTPTDFNNGETVFKPSDDLGKGSEGVICSKVADIPVIESNSETTANMASIDSKATEPKVSTSEATSSADGANISSETPDVESEQKVSTSDAANASDKIPEAQFPTSAATDGADKESETMVDPQEDFKKVMAAVQLSHELLQQAKAAAEAPARLHSDFIRSYFPVDPEDGHYIYCVVCGLSGDLLCCDGCPNVLHPSCAGLSEIPEGDWFCAVCSSKGPSTAPSTATTDGGSPKKATLASPDDDINDANNVEETWTLKFIGTAPFDFEKEAELAKILEELRLLRAPPPEAQKPDAVENLKSATATENVSTKKDNSSMEPPTESNDCSTSQRMPDGFIQVGLAITKIFNAGAFTGKVTSLPTKAHPFYRIQYEDGDEEDMTVAELQDHLPLSTLKKLKGLLQQKPQGEMDESHVQQYVAVSSSDSRQRHRKGRPRKGEARPASPIKQQSVSSSRKSLRRKDDTTTTSTSASVLPPKRPRGRPRKYPLVVAPAPPSPPLQSLQLVPVVSRVQDLEENPIPAKHPRFT